MPTDNTTLLPKDGTSPVAPLSEEPEAVTPQPPAEGEAPAPPEPAKQAEGSSPPEPKPEDPPKAEDPPKPEPTARERLIAKLTGEDQEPKVESPTPTEDPPPKAEAPPEPKEPDAPPPAGDDDDLTELTNDTAGKIKPGEYRRKVNKLIARVKQAEPLAAVGKDIIELCEANQLDPADYKAWVEIGIGLQQGNAKALEALKNVAHKAGVIPAAAPAVLPADLDTWLDEQVKDLEISREAAKALREKFKATPPKAADPPPAPAPQPRQQLPQQQPGVSPEYMNARTRAVNEIGRIADEYEKRLGADRFAELEPKIQEALKARKGRHPDAWPDIYRSAVETELAKAPKLATPGASLRPGSAPSSSTPQFKTERERLLHKYGA